MRSSWLADDLELSQPYDLLYFSVCSSLALRLIDVRLVQRLIACGSCASAVGFGAL